MSDVAILGVSIVQTYRSQFREVLGSGGSAELLAQLRDHGRFSVPD